jgi:hypothetical protein
MIFAVRAPDGSVMGGKASMREAQDWISELEPDVLEQGKWQIHPIASPEDAERAQIKLCWTLKLEKFEGEQCVEVIEREGVN